MTKRKVSEHQRSCAKCLAIKQANITAKNLIHNQSASQKQIASETAKKTSARRDIQLQRAERLHAWQAANPEKLRENIYKAQKSAKKSKAEAWLRNSGTLTWCDGRVRCGEDRKQVDFIHPEKDIWIEIDGFFHFFALKRAIARASTLKTIQQRDAMLNQEALRRGATLIRIAGSCFRSSDGKMKDEWLAVLTAMLRLPQPGVWCLGKLYEYVPWASEGCTIWKYPIQSTTLSSQTV